MKMNAPGQLAGRRPASLLVCLTTCLLLAMVLLTRGAGAAELPDLIDQIKPSIVVIGTYSQTRSPPFLMRGTGFVVGDGTLVATNAHVIPDVLDAKTGEMLVIQVPSSGQRPQQRAAKNVADDPSHDLALLRIDGAPLPAMALHEERTRAVREGQSVAFTGFPIGGVLGLSPVTHRGIISAITPIALPGPSARQLDAKLIRRLKSGSFAVYQLDGTAYPGNSGGPLFEMDKGEVLGIINMVFVKETKESILTKPSGISFAVPVEYLRDLLKEAR